MFSSHALTQYVFGLRWKIPDGGRKRSKLRVAYDTIAEHVFGKKTIPSNFFNQPDSEHVSAIIFTNSGTFPKFERMGYQAGHHRGNVKIIRTGCSYNPDPNSVRPNYFRYSLDGPPVEETWGQGMVVLHNPNALNPIPLDFFVDATQQYIKDGAILSDIPGFQPFSSITDIILIEDDSFQPLEATDKRVGSILKSQYEQIGGFRRPGAEQFSDETGWFTDRRKVLLGVVIRDKTDDDWAYAILGRDQNLQFYAIETEVNFSKEAEARTAMMRHTENIFDTGQRVFHR